MVLGFKKREFFCLQCDIWIEGGDKKFWLLGRIVGDVVLEPEIFEPIDFDVHVFQPGFELVDFVRIRYSVPRSFQPGPVLDPRMDWLGFEPENN